MSCRRLLSSSRRMDAHAPSSSHCCRPARRPRPRLSSPACGSAARSRDDLRDELRRSPLRPSPSPASQVLALADSRVAGDRARRRARSARASTGSTTGSATLEQPGVVVAGPAQAAGRVGAPERRGAPPRDARPGRGAAPAPGARALGRDAAAAEPRDRRPHRSTAPSTSKCRTRTDDGVLRPDVVVSLDRRQAASSSTPRSRSTRS